MIIPEDLKLDLSSILLNKFISKNAVIGVIGLGYVGLPLSLAYAENGFQTVGFDIDDKKISFINNGLTYIKHIEEKRIKETLSEGLLRATSDFSEISFVDAVIICVPTPLTINSTPDLTFIKKTLSQILPFIKVGQILSLESTTYPGTTEDVILPKLKENGLVVGRNFFLVYSPEREDPGNKNFQTKDIPKIVGADTENCLRMGHELYSQIVQEVILVSSTKAAELTKLFENIHRAVNIGLVNELKVLADKMDLDIYEIINAAKTKPFGFTPYYPGPGLGGHCLPIDPFYLSWKAKEYGINTRFIELAGEINSSMPIYVLEKINYALNSISKSIKGSRILVLGISYKKNVDDLRESPSLKIMELLENRGAIINYSDPFFQEIPQTRNYSFNLKSISISAHTISLYDLIVLSTDHDCFDYKLIKENAKLIVDTRGRYKSDAKIIRA